MELIMHSKKTHILYVHYGDNWIRGSEVCLLKLIENLDKNIYQPIVWCNSAILCNEVAKLGITAIKGNFSVLFGWNAPKLDFKNFFRLISDGINIIKNHQINLVHCNSAAPNQWMLPATKFTSTPMVLHLHSPYVLRDRLTLGLIFSSNIVGVSNAVIHSLKNDGVAENNLSVIYNGLDEARSNRENTIDIKTRFDIPTNTFVFVTLGSLINRKGIDIVINAVHKVIQKGLSAKLIVIGDGPERKNLQDLCNALGVSEHIIFAGEVKNARSLLIKGVDIVLSGAREEAFGLSLIEAGFAKLPVIAPRVGGIPEVIHHDKTGILVQTESPASIADAIMKLCQDAPMRNRLGRSAFARAKTAFSVETYIKKFELLYQNALVKDNCISTRVITARNTVKQILLVAKNTLKIIAKHSVYKVHKNV